ncbi:MAG TPA: hypothetical protein VFN62_03685 [Acidobacteriaceae bacterium]|nr:hypothetical protein [Acidobacteriaceae bacterium]
MENPSRVQTHPGCPILDAPLRQGWDEELDHRAITYSWMFQESEVESRKHQNNSNIRAKPFPEPPSEEQKIHADNHDDHHLRIQQDHSR